MKLKSIVKDSTRYAVSDWRNFLVLGVILFLTDHLIELDNFSTFDGTFSSLIIIGLIIIVLLFLSFLEIGYGFRIVEETVQGSTLPPSFHHPLNLFTHGVKESVILIVYFILPVILFILGLAWLVEMTNLDFGPLNLSLTILIAAIFFLCFNITMQGAILTMAHHEGSLRWGFNLPHVFRKIRRVGIGNMLLVSLITIAVLIIVRSVLFDTLHGIPFLGSTVGDVIATVLVAPFLMIFTTRLLGLIDLPDYKLPDKEIK
ncbi:MAG: hypothetical protein B655_0418 [Methanobacterium sp. Maddingley MBC34]|nr:MAG: hypothetical protein B655_0418 [Methanobacterium sp. Maddingley MBC34]